MYDAATVTAVATDGSHYCEFCGKVIREGERFQFSAALDDGEFCTQYLCQVCGRMWDEASREADGEPVTEYDVIENLCDEYCNACTHECPPPEKMRVKSQCPIIRAHYGEAEDRKKNYGYWYGEEDEPRNVVAGFETREGAARYAKIDADEHSGEACYTARMASPDEWLDPIYVGLQAENSLREAVHEEIDETVKPVVRLSDKERHVLGDMVLAFFASRGKFNASAAMPFDIEELDS
ncbi:MAG: hypothetical protein IK051_07055 [Rhodocyclaceae bacterium]|nr:hypothetical protein [Rhodocyclaceae bacterium]